MGRGERRKSSGKGREERKVEQRDTESCVCVCVCGRGLTIRDKVTIHGSRLMADF